MEQTEHIAKVLLVSHTTHYRERHREHLRKTEMKCSMKVRESIVKLFDSICSPPCINVKRCWSSKRYAMLEIEYSPRLRKICTFTFSTKVCLRERERRGLKQMDKCACGCMVQNQVIQILARAAMGHFNCPIEEEACLESGSSKIQ
ncbi:hypothetical protein KP509_13G019500 [Ceratopteris richardii]|nr:hypothetical protein KP509_13G019500 [Ceratopteris richardii]